MSDDLTCSSCGARVTPGLQWCSLCHADLRPQPSPEELAALPPPQVQPPNAPQTAADIQRTSPPPPTGIPIPPPSVGGQAQPPRGAHPIPPPPSAGQAPSPGSVGPANPQNIEQWGALLASSESQQQSRLGKATSSRGSRIAVALLGAVGVMLILTVIGVVLGALFS